MKRVLIFMFAVSFMASCGVEVGPNVNFDDDDDDSSWRHTYEYEENGCSTGKQKFKNKKDYCRGLRDEGRNKGCAYAARMKAHERDCD